MSDTAKTDAEQAKPAGLADVRKFFEYESATDFRTDWTKLSKDERAQIQTGIGDGSYTY